MTMTHSLSETDTKGHMFCQNTMFDLGTLGPCAIHIHIAFIQVTGFYMA